MGAYIQYIYFLPIVLMLVMIFYSSNKRKKEQEKLISSFKVGDKVVTIGGIKGTIASVNETTIEIKVDSNTKLTLIKSAISVVKINENIPPIPSLGVNEYGQPL